jgi:hypothetical protein
MAVLSDSDYRILGPVRRRVYAHHWGGTTFREEGEFTVEWNCDAKGGETTHEATFATMFGGGWELASWGPHVPHGEVTGKYTETYRQDFSDWAPLTP